MYKFRPPNSLSLSASDEVVAENHSCLMPSVIKKSTLYLTRRPEVLSPGIVGSVAGSVMLPVSDASLILPLCSPQVLAKSSFLVRRGLPGSQVSCLHVMLSKAESKVGGGCHVVVAKSFSGSNSFLIREESLFWKPFCKKPLISLLELGHVPTLIKIPGNKEQNAMCWVWVHCHLNKMVG